jgi:hypothetical protein
MEGKEPSLPGMSEEEWKFREGSALTDHGVETSDYELARQGLDMSVNALQETLRPYLTERFQELFPGEETPDDIQELGYRVKEKEIDLLIEEEDQ